MLIFGLWLFFFIIGTMPKVVATHEDSAYADVCNLIEDLDKTYSKLEAHLPSVPNAASILVLLKDYNQDKLCYLIYYKGFSEEDFKHMPLLALPLICLPSASTHLIKGLKAWLAEHQHFDVFHIAAPKHPQRALCHRCTKFAFNHFGIVDLVASATGCCTKLKTKPTSLDDLAHEEEKEIAIQPPTDAQPYTSTHNTTQNSLEPSSSSLICFSLGSLFLCLYAFARRN